MTNLTLTFTGMVSIKSTQDPTQLYFVKGNSVLMTSRLQDVDKISGKPIEYTRLVIFQLDLTKISQMGN